MYNNSHAKRSLRRHVGSRGIRRSKTQSGHRVGRDVSYISTRRKGDARIHSTHARAANGVVVGCSPPASREMGNARSPRWGLVDRPYPLFYSSCRAPTFIPPRAGGSARTYLLFTRESQSRRTTARGSERTASR